MPDGPTCSENQPKLRFEIGCVRWASPKIGRTLQSNPARVALKTSNNYPSAILCQTGQIKSLRVFRQARKCTLPWLYTSAICRALNVRLSVGLGRERAPCALDKTYCTYCTGARTSCAEVEVERALGALAEGKLELSTR